MKVCPECGVNFGERQAEVTVGLATIKEHDFVYDGKKIKLGPQQAKLVKALMLANGKTMSKDALMNRMTKSISDDDKDLTNQYGLVTVLISQTRGLFEKNGLSRKLIKNHHAHGYYWNVEADQKLQKPRMRVPVSMKTGEFTLQG